MKRYIPLLCMSLACCGEPPPEQPTVQPLRRAAVRLGDHGELALGSSMETELSRAQPLHSWQFTLTARADVVLNTEASVAAAPNARDVDTVLILQRIEPSGAPSWLAQNDDFGRSRYSRISRALPAGKYQAQVHGFRPSVHGRFAFATACSGAGCPAPEPGCWFGDSFQDLRTHATLRIASETWLRSASDVNGAERAQVILAVQQSSHSDVATLEEALAAVDHGEVRRMELRDANGSVYLAFEYGAGDNSYGAIFAAGSTHVLASIHDGDLIDCAPKP